MSSARRSSLGMLLRRSKSGDLGKGGRKASKQSQEQQREAIPKSPPRLPVLYNGAPAPELDTFEGEPRPDSVAIISGKLEETSSARPSMEPGYHAVAPPMPPIPANGGYVDPYARTESMTHRGRYSYASSAISTINSPRRVRRRKDPTPFNILVIGTRGSGKTSFLEFLKTALALPAKKRAKQSELDEMPVRLPQGNFIPHYLETEIDNERVGLTLWDSEGLEKNVVDLQLREMSAFLESKFEETFAEEMKVIRSPGVQDTHIHAVFLILDPARLDRNISAAKANGANGQMNGGKYQPHRLTRIVGSLDEDLDLQVLRTLQGKTTVIPVISKADTITSKHMAVLKRTVSDSLKKAKLDPLEVLGLDDEDAASNNSDRIDEVDEDAEAPEEDPESLPIQGQEPEEEAETSSKRQSQSSMVRKEPEEEEEPFLPMSIISPDIYEPEVVGRQFPWGFADPYNEDHCDFVRLKDAVFSEWRGELREASREQWYEGWRTSRLKQRDGSKLRR